MPLQNRVAPTGEIVAVAERGTMMGNRGGALHGPDRRLGARRWVSRQWICCRLAFNQRHRQVMAPGRYTELFFLDETTALAAGHRPCFECRRADALRFAEMWGHEHGFAARPSADAIDRLLHAERVDTAGGKQTHEIDCPALPDGAMIRFGTKAAPHLVLGDALRPWSFRGYGAPLPRPRSARVVALTPQSIIAVLKSGYRPSMHDSAFEAG